MMTLFPNSVAQRGIATLNRVYSNHVVLKRWMSEGVHKYVGAPELPLPGSQEYAESMQRLANLRTIEMLSKNASKNQNPSNNMLQKLMDEVRLQNAKLLQEMSQLTRRVEQLESTKRHS